MTSAPAWPAVGYETLPWRSRYEQGTASRAEIRRHAGPYRAAVLPPIADNELLLPGETAAAAADAAAEIARFDAELGGEIAPFASVLLRSESAASSRIENLTASARAIAEAELGARGSGNAAEVVANTRAMDAAIALADRLDADAILAMHAALMADTDPAIAGAWRTDQVWIGGGRLGPHQALFVPPQAAGVAPAIADLVRFLARDDLPVLPHAAVAHAQFETIHPFPDGNGRTGRALLHAVLRSKGLTRSVTAPVSAGLLTDTAAYFAALDAYRAGDPTAIVRALADASFAAVTNGRALVAELRELRARWGETVRARRDSAVWRVADLLLRHPVVDAALLTRELGVAGTNVYRSLEPLQEAGVLVVTGDGRRNRTWRAPEVLAALDAFAARAGRRAP
ncbi:MAG: filamentation induced by cAMP protein Fic [Mycobacterium sp.]|nr:filamentation induced by cAMP protein Fic [Mycobacterium sp.]